MIFETASFEVREARNYIPILTLLDDLDLDRLLNSKYQLPHLYSRDSRTYFPGSVKD